MDLVSGIADGSCQFAGEIVVLPKDVVGQALRAFTANARSLPRAEISRLIAGGKCLDIF